MLHVARNDICPRVGLPPTWGFFLGRQKALRCSFRASRTSWHKEIPRARATSLARPFVPCVTRVVIVVGCLRPVDALGADPLGGCELTVCAASDVLSSERGAFVWFNILKPDITILYSVWSRMRSAIRFVVIDFQRFSTERPNLPRGGRFCRLGWFLCHVFGMRTKKGTSSGVDPVACLCTSINEQANRIVARMRPGVWHALAARVPSLGWLLSVCYSNGLVHLWFRNEPSAFPLFGVPLVSNN